MHINFYRPSGLSHDEQQYKSVGQLGVVSTTSTDNFKNSSSFLETTHNDNKEEPEYEHKYTAIFIFI